MSSMMATSVKIATERPEPPSPPVSFEDYLAWSLKEDIHAEWVDGEIVPMAPSNVDHHDLNGWLYHLLIRFIDARRLGRLFISQILMRLSIRPSGRMPDLMFVSKEHVDRIRETYVDGPADLVVEIVSLESNTRDRAEKLVEYEGAGIPEYWLIDSLRREAAFYLLGEDGRYHRAPVDPEGLYRSAMLPGFWLPVEWLWQRPLPEVAEILRQIEA
jgi:Uma2 family endonuclease